MYWNRAKRIALDKVPGASMTYLEREEDDGRIVYEGENYYEHRQYEFKIDASTGDILEWEQDQRKKLPAVRPYTSVGSFIFAGNGPSSRACSGVFDF